MNNILKVSLIVIAVLAIAGGLFFAGSIFGSFWLQRTFIRSAGIVPGGMMTSPGGMMDRRGGLDTEDFRGGQPYGRNGMGMPGGRMGPGGGMYGQNRNQANLTPLSVDEAKKAAQEYVTALKLDGLQLGEVMIFDNNAYVIVKETASGNGAFELLVDPFTKSAYPEHGANMMWNLKYGGVVHAGMMNGHGGGMMGGWNSQNATPADVSAEMPISQEQAIKAAQTWLDTAWPGATAATDATKFYGYYTLDFSKDGKVVGMLSVNGYNGQVLPHVWHGTFIEEAK